jgi:hypothetical protein
MMSLKPPHCPLLARTVGPCRGKIEQKHELMPPSRTDPALPQQRLL